ncbi:LLM class flavin-dependent oxidoreductase [Paenibacillus periandrae]|uniref:LLM class flavin-dependent oxidoreductase n=1 Tax=Paenibacillus periandrae TaxID=1761741 RepID=UPI001F0889A9|nr:LLM class flavin-dependent oxidoreductase [Paenibacillus periandrae]
MSETDRKLHINLFLFMAGHHEAAWRHPLAQPERTLDVNFYKHLAQTAERGLLDSLFISDNYSGTWRRFEPFTLLSGLATVTEHIGLIATVNTTYNEPFHVARKFVSLDHLSGGRAAWNIVTGGGSDAHNFGLDEHPEHAKRYENAEEFVEVVKQLWDSWEDDALVYDKQAGIQIDSSKVHEIDFKGSSYSVKGPLNIPRGPQGHPVLVQAGSSDSGKELAAKTAEVIFTAQQSLTGAQDFYRDVKARLAKYGRTPEQLQILPGLSPIIADTVAEARDIENELFELTDWKGAIQRLSERLGIDFSGYSPDSRIPSIEGARSAETIQGMKSRHQLLIDQINTEQPTFRELIMQLAGARGHLTFTGTPLQLADVIEHWFKERGADGFNLMPPIFPSGLEIFVDKVIPELQNRGLFRTAYEGTTLRENLGLARPVNLRHAVTN